MKADGRELVCENPLLLGKERNLLLLFRSDPIPIVRDIYFERLLKIWIKATVSSVKTLEHATLALPQSLPEELLATSLVEHLLQATTVADYVAISPRSIRVVFDWHRIHTRRTGTRGEVSEPHEVGTLNFGTGLGNAESAVVELYVAVAAGAV